MRDLRLLDETPKSPTILVVDDDPTVLYIVVESIKAEGFEVESCGDGLTALEMSAQNEYDLIVTDMKLPECDGLSLLKRLKTMKSDTDVIVITGYGSIENAVECMRAGALDYIIKPFTVDQIQVAVRKALEHRELRRKALERELYRELSYLDPLTGVHNRRHFDEALAAELSKAERHQGTVSLMMMDVDDFKCYNDMFGHQRGDDALIRLGRLLKETCRVYDIITRYGGEEFAVIFPDVGSRHAAELAERVLLAIRNAPFEGEEQLPSGRLTVSIGVACYPDHANKAKDLIRCTDLALYEAKRLGKDRVRFYDPNPQLCSIGQSNL